MDQGGDLQPLQRRDPRRIGPYRVIGRLGEGGMGVVYAATHRDLQVAVKLIRSEYVSDPQFRTRFRREVALVARVEGACVATFLAADAEAAHPWLATAYAPGPTLAAHVSSTGPLIGQPLIALATSIAEALAAIHRAGVIHRDLKPANVILSPDGPKVLDFGIARAFDETAITRTHVFVGSTGWASPEQYRGGEEIGSPSDVYSWGMTVAFAGAGRPPLGTGSMEVMAHRVFHESPVGAEHPIIGDFLQSANTFPAIDSAVLVFPSPDLPSSAVSFLFSALNRASSCTSVLVAGFGDRPFNAPESMACR